MSIKVRKKICGGYMIINMLLSKIDLFSSI